jgi:hypothetical protein
MMNRANIYSEEKTGEENNREERNKVYLFIGKETDKNMSRQMMFSIDRWKAGVWAPIVSNRG